MSGEAKRGGFVFILAELLKMKPFLKGKVQETIQENWKKVHLKTIPKNQHHHHNNKHNHHNDNHNKNNKNNKKNEFKRQSTQVDFCSWPSSGHPPQKSLRLIALFPSRQSLTFAFWIFGRSLKKERFLLLWFWNRMFSSSFPNVQALCRRLASSSSPGSLGGGFGELGPNGFLFGCEAMDSNRFQSLFVCLLHSINGFQWLSSFFKVFHKRNSHFGDDKVAQQSFSFWLSRVPTGGFEPLQQRLKMIKGYKRSIFSEEWLLCSKLGQGSFCSFKETAS